LETVVTRLVVTHWTSDLAITQTLVFFGVIAGVALGQSRFSKPVVILIAVVYGLFLICWQTSLSLEVDLQWSTRLGMISNRIFGSIHDWFSGVKLQDSLLFLVMMYILFWVVAVHAGFMVTRYGHAWQAVLPGGLALAVIDWYDRYTTRHSWYLAVFVFFALTLIGRVTYILRNQRWKETRTTLKPHLDFEFIRYTLILALVIILLSWGAPALANEAMPAAQKALEPIAHIWSNFRDKVDEALAPLRSTLIYINNPYGPNASLGLGNDLPATLNFTVKAPTDPPENLRFYWRARTYDSYGEGQWFSTINKRIEYYAHPDELALPKDLGRWPGSFLITTSIGFSTIIMPSQPLWTDRPGQVEFAENPDGTIDLSLFRPAPALRAGQTYTAQALVANATVAELRSAGTNYPTWVTNRYLQLPGTITNRTRQLAQDITTGLDTPYDKAEAITNYLRQNITYAEVIKADLPAEQDPIDWFLFSIKTGFCNYYSSAEVILLRTLGIPARWVVGYAEGEPAEGDIFFVRAKDSHSWPEIYFPSYGWVEFEPTASQSAILRLPGEVNAVPSNNAQGQMPINRQRQFEEEMQQLEKERNQSAASTSLRNTANLAYGLLVIPLLFGAGFLTWYYRKHKTLPSLWLFGIRLNLHNSPILLEKALLRMGVKPPKAVQTWARQAELPLLSRAYMEINYALKRMNQPPALNDTPAERAQALGEILPTAQESAWRLVIQYQIGTFSNQEADAASAIVAGSEIRNLSIKVMAQRWLSRLQLLQGENRSSS
jgi:hypothetical protein